MSNLVADNNFPSPDDSGPVKNKPLTINELVAKANATAREKGFWEDGRSNLEALALIVSEIGEAVEECRVDGPAIYVSTETNKPEGLVIELADAVLRIADLCGERGYDLEMALKIKMAYNEQRPRKHGKLL